MKKFEPILIMIGIVVMIGLVLSLIILSSIDVKPIQNERSIGIKYTSGSHIIDLRIYGSDDMSLLTSLISSENLTNLSVDKILKKYLQMKGINFDMNNLYRVDTDVLIDGKILLIYEYYVGGLNG